MILFTKRIVPVLIFVLTLTTACHKKKGGYNPYLHDKIKPSKVEAGKQKNAEKKAARAYKRQTRRTSMRLYNRKPGPSPKK